MKRKHFHTCVDCGNEYSCRVRYKMGTCGEIDEAKFPPVCYDCVPTFEDEDEI